MKKRICPAHIIGTRWGKEGEDGGGLPVFFEDDILFECLANFWMSRSWSIQRHVEGELGHLLLGIVAEYTGVLVGAMNKIKTKSQAERFIELASERSQCLWMAISLRQGYQIVEWPTRIFRKRSKHKLLYWGDM